MKIKRLFLLLVLFPLLLSCGKGNAGYSIPPPSPVDPVTPEDPDDPEEEDDTPKPWDENRGKVVRPTAGNGWTVTPIDGKDIVYYYYEGKESVTGANQRIFVTDVNLDNTAYSLKLAYYSSKSTASKVLKGTGALACINAGYEKGALYLKVGGSVIASISNVPYISSDAQVYQWKSEGAIYMDNARDIRFDYPRKLGVTRPEDYAPAWRNYYRQKAASEQNILTSAPVLIDDYEPVGLDFCTRHPLQEWGQDCSENPYKHQGSTSNPRTAIAKTHDNHVLLIVVDGRRSVSRGISAAELTTFLVNNFNPQYALNLDGGGSSTMCVEGQGDPDTHVVNYPTDSDKIKGVPDHSGERERDTYIYVVKKK